MKALRLNALGEEYSGCALEEIVVPQPGPGEVRIRVLAAAVNFVDLLMTTGGYQNKPALPFTLGSDVAGIIDAVGPGVDAFRVGDEVMGMRMGGAFSEFAVLPSEAVNPKPAAFHFEHGAAYGAAYFSAYHALMRRGCVTAGDWVLIHGATGGLGLAAVDLARALDLRVIAGSGSPEKLDIVAREYAPAATLDTTGAFRDRVLELTGGRGVDVVLDPVGGELFRESTRCIAFDGRYLVVGFTSGEIPEMRLNIPLIKGFSVVGVRAGEYGRRFPERGAADRRALWHLADHGALSPRVHARFALEDWREAFDLLKKRGVVGRVVLCPNGRGG